LVYPNSVCASYIVIEYVFLFKGKIDHRQSNFLILYGGN
jgi:hypothetical protein